MFDAAEPIFDAVASQYFLLGPSGSGTSMKLAVNTLLGIGMQAVAEAIALGEAEGLDRKRLLDVLAQTTVIAPAHKGKLAKEESERRDPLSTLIESAARNGQNLAMLPPPPARDAVYQLRADTRQS